MSIELALIGTGLGLGLRHGVDWDHIAAITDVTGTQPERVKAVRLGTLYALGHATVVVALGLERVARSLLFEIDGTHPGIIVAAVLALGAVALSAGFIPAHRASRIDPMTALRRQ